MIDLDQIIESNPRKYCNCRECQKWIMKKAISQALDMAAEEATIWVESDINGTEFDKAEFEHEGFTEVVTVHKDSILSIKDKVK